MGKVITLEVSKTLVRRAESVALYTHQRLEDVFLGWMDRASIEIPVESLPDDQVLILCEMQMDAYQQETLSDLLARNREGVLTDVERIRLDKLMQIYRRGLVRKARSMTVAVKRGLKPPLSEEYASSSHS